MRGNMKIVIMAGGKGTRIAELNSQVPKPMIPIDGKPILEYQIDTLRRQGYKEFILVIGHLGHVITDYFNDGSKWGVHIQYIMEESPLGTAGALYFLKDIITEEFLLLNGDIIFDVDIERFRNCHLNRKTMATILTHPNSHPYDSALIAADSDNIVTGWFHKEDPLRRAAFDIGTGGAQEDSSPSACTSHWFKNRVNAGLHMLSPEIFRFFPELRKRDLDRDILKPLISHRELSIYDSPEYIKDMGTPERFYSVLQDIRCGKVQARNLMNRQKAVFLDRDGTLNTYQGFLTDIHNFHLTDGAAQAVRRINDSGFLAIVITNQPVIARGELSPENLLQIHNKMETLLGIEGAYLDDIFFCPHHPHKGFQGERAEYKIDCPCRKPKPGMLFQAAEKYNIDLSASWMVGDSDSDIKAGQAAGCRTVLLGDGLTLPRAVDCIMQSGS